MKWIERAAREEIARLISEGPSVDELSRIKSGTNGGLIRGLDKVSGKADLLSSNQTFHDDPAHYRIELKWQREATPNDVRNAAQRWLSHGDLSLQVLPRPDFKAAAADTNRDQLPALGAPPALTLPPLQHFTLSNGLNVVFAERHAVPTVDAQILFDAGRAADVSTPGGKSGLANITLDMLDEGVDSYDALGFERRSQELGAEFSAGTNRDISVVGDVRTQTAAVANA